MKGNGTLCQKLYTDWGKNIDTDNVLSEYPSPLLKRDSYINLNGIWQYAFTSVNKKPNKFDGDILVPFSPEAPLSGVNRQLKPNEYLWYEKTVMYDSKKLSETRLILHFGAVDQICTVYINSIKVCSHTGGYLPFDADITNILKNNAKEKSFTLTVCVKDISDTSYHARGKQSLNPKGMLYTAQSGIWQTVWLEYVPKNYIRKIITQPDLDKKVLRIKIITNSSQGRDKNNNKLKYKSTKTNEIKICINNPEMYTDIDVNNNSENDVRIKEMHSKKHGIPFTYYGISDTYIEIPLNELNIKAWTPDTPYLYTFSIDMGNDHVESYFALRTFTIEKDNNNIPRICLNHKPLFQKGVLDQGYWPDGLYTAPSDKALIYDIKTMKSLGFNMLRKHIKIESERWYYHCDRLGMIVWQDMVNGGSHYKSWFVTYLATFMSIFDISCSDKTTYLFARKSDNEKKEFIRETLQTVRTLSNHPSIATWVIFNEGWGQFDTNRITKLVRKADKTRLIDQASGWFDQGMGDIKSIHNYFFPLRLFKKDKRAYALTEFGGYTQIIKHHNLAHKCYGYGACKNSAHLKKRYIKRENEISALIPSGLCASIYTQLSDVENELNGILTYDRAVNKFKFDFHKH